MCYGLTEATETELHFFFNSDVSEREELFNIVARNTPGINILTMMKNYTNVNSGVKCN